MHPFSLNDKDLDLISGGLGLSSRVGESGEVIPPIAVSILNVENGGIATTLAIGEEGGGTMPVGEDGGAV